MFLGQGRCKGAVDQHLQAFLQQPHPTLTPIQRQGHMAVVRELIADAGRRSCVKALAKDGSTVLHVAAAAGHAAVVQQLLDAGARTDARDRVRISTLP
jgi:ankyrin repeat protein